MSPAANQRWVGHADIDAFYASVEQRDHPEYRDRPVVVGALPGNRGVVSAASYAARAFGVRSAMPIAEAYRRCPDAVYLTPDMAKYSAVSRQVFEVLGSITPVIEPVSIDEAFLDLSGLDKLFGEPESIGRRIKRLILDATGLHVSVGIGPNRLIAKLASEHRKPDGLVVVKPEQVDRFLAPMPVSNLRGLGRQTLKIFARLGIDTVAQLRAVPRQYLDEHLGANMAAKFLTQAHGIGSDAVVPERGRKSISKETTFGKDVADSEYLRDTLRYLAAEVAAIARHEQRRGKIVTLKVRFSDFDTHTRQHQLPTSTYDERVVFKQAWALFQHGDLPRKPVRLVGVGISAWEDNDTAQRDLFEKAGDPKRDERLLETLDRAASRFGKGALQIGAAPKSTQRKPR